MQILDYDQYFLNLTDVISGGLEQWQKSYSMLDYYGLESLSFSNLSHHVHQVNNILNTRRMKSLTITRFTVEG